MTTATKEFETLSGIATETNEETRRVDAGTLLGVVAGVCLIMIAIFRGGDPGVFMNLNSALIVLGGTIATTFIAFSSKKVIGLLPVIVNAFKPDVYQPADFIEDIMALSVKYRTGGLKKLESQEEFLDNRFLKTGITLVVDGYSAREIHEILDRQLFSMTERHHAGHKILRFMAVQAPVFGMAGTLIGLIQMLMHLNSPETIGPSLATALITTFYGLIMANLIITPIVAKLNTRTESEIMLNKAIRVGILGIHDRINPQKIKRNMNALLPPHQQK